MKLKILISCFFSLLFLADCFAQMPDNIIVGTVYNIFHEEYPSDEDFFRQADKDIQMMKESNITHIMIFPMSQWDPNTKQLLWKRTDYLIKKIEEAKLKFVPLMLKEQQCSHYFPIWKFREFPSLWDSRNQNNKNNNNREDIDFADPRFFPLVEDYFRAVIERYGKSPALSFYNIWNEPHYNSDAEHVIERYRLWLKEKYRSLQKLSASWGEDYSGWDQVSPFVNDNWNSSMPQIDWITFRNELNGILLGELVKVLRKYDTVHPVNANPVGTTWANFGGFGYFNTDNWVFTRYNDFNGISYYPDAWEREHNMERCPFWLHNLSFNTIRSSSAEKDYILTELYTNVQNALALNGYLDKDEVKLLAWTALANDCKGMIYWKWEPFMRGRQSLGRGLCNVSGKLAPRGEAVKDLGSVMKNYGQKIFQAHPRKPEIAIMLDMTGLLKTLEQSTESSTNKFMYESNAGLFKALYEANLMCDVIRTDRKVDPEMLKKYKIIYLPFQIVMRPETAEMLKEYVKQGGWLAADARTATLDQLDFAFRKSPGCGLDEVFGAERNDWTAQKNYFKVRMKDTFISAEFEGRYFRDLLVPKGNSEVIGTFTDSNEPAVVQNHYGKGNAVLSAVPLGASYFGRSDSKVNRFLVSLAEKAGVMSEAGFYSEDNSFLDLKIHELKNECFIYAVNSENREKSGIIKINPRGHRIKNLKDIITGQNLSFETKDNFISIPVRIKSNDVMIILAEE